MPSKRLTAKFIAGITTEKASEEHWDTVVKGLILRVNKGGTKTFYLSYRNQNRKKVRFKLGSTKEISLADAREIAQQNIGLVARGEDPQRRKRDEYRRHQSAPSVADICEIYLERKSVRDHKPKTRNEIQRALMREVVPKIGHLKAEEVRKRHIIELVESIASRGALSQANKVRTYIQMVFNYACQSDYIEISPCNGLPKKYKESHRDRILSSDEISAFWDATLEQPQVTKSLFRILLLTGQRRGETMKMEWSQVKGNEWIIPKENTKNGLKHIVPLSDLALSALYELPQNSKWVFDTGKGPYKWTHYANKRLICEMRSEPWRVHDLRHTAATWIQQNHSMDIVAAVLNHKQQRITARYSHYDYANEKRKALDGWAKYISRIVRLQPTNVIKLVQNI